MKRTGVSYFLHMINLVTSQQNYLATDLQVAATSDLMLGYMDFFLGGDEKRSDLPPRLHQRFPMTLMFGGNGSYMAPFCLHNDNIVTSLMSQVSWWISLLE